MSVEQRMRADLTAAMKARDLVRVGALRRVLAAIANAEAPPAQPVTLFAAAGTTEVARLVLTDEDIAAILRGEIAEREAAVRLYLDAAKTPEAQRLRAEMDIIRAYLA